MQNDSFQTGVHSILSNQGQFKPGIPTWLTPSDTKPESGIQEDPIEEQQQSRHMTSIQSSRKPTAVRRRIPRRSKRKLIKKRLVKKRPFKKRPRKKTVKRRQIKLKKKKKTRYRR